MRIKALTAVVASQRVVVVVGHTAAVAAAVAAPVSPPLDDIRRYAVSLDRLAPRLRQRYGAYGSV